MPRRSSFLFRLLSALFSVSLFSLLFLFPSSAFLSRFPFTLPPTFFFLRSYCVFVSISGFLVQRCRIAWLGRAIERSWLALPGQNNLGRRCGFADARRAWRPALRRAARTVLLCPFARWAGGWGRDEPASNFPMRRPDPRSRAGDRNDVDGRPMPGKAKRGFVQQNAGRTAAPPGATNLVQNEPGQGWARGNGRRRAGARGGKGKRERGKEKEERGKERKREEKRKYARRVDVKKKPSEIVAPLSLRLSRCAGSKKSNPDFQRPIERLSFDFSAPPRSASTGESVNAFFRLSQGNKREGKSRAGKNPAERRQEQRGKEKGPDAAPPGVRSGPPSGLAPIGCHSLTPSAAAAKSRSCAKRLLKAPASSWLTPASISVLVCSARKTTCAA